MLAERTVTLRLDDDIAMSSAVESAIGYLATWAVFGGSGRYAGNVTITSDKDSGLTARYHSTEGEMTYLIYGLPERDNDDRIVRYSFHS